MRLPVSNGRWASGGSLLVIVCGQQATWNCKVVWYSQLAALAYALQMRFTP